MFTLGNTSILLKLFESELCAFFSASIFSVASSFVFCSLSACTSVASGTSCLYCISLALWSSSSICFLIASLCAWSSSVSIIPPIFLIASFLSLFTLFILAISN
jgi:hypothetical protein